MIDLLSGKQSISSTQSIAGSWLQGVRDSLRNKWLVFRSSVLGTVIGFIPGLGGSVVDWMAWGFAKNTIKDNYFGKGDIRGVIAVESATNSKEGGSLIPTLMFGIPGGGTTAILLGGLTLMGLQAGPRMVTTDLPVTMSIVWTLVFANVIGAVACIVLAKHVARLTLIPANKLVPFLMILLVIGAYQSTRHWGDLIVFVGLGVVAWFMKHLDWPRAPLLIGFVLAVPVERYLWISISRYEYTWLTNPGVIIIGIIIIAILASGIWIERKNKANRGDDDEEGEPMYL
jgi:TctA family transporter